MTKKKLPVRFTGQHFTIDKVLIKDAIRQANIEEFYKLKYCSTVVYMVPRA